MLTKMPKTLNARHAQLAAAALAVVALLVLAGEAFACTCFAQPAKQRLKHADAAVDVKVLSVRRPEPVPMGEGRYHYPQYVATVKLLRVYKGPLRLREAETAKIKLGQAINSCAIDLAEGKRYGLLPRKTGRTWSAGLCDLIGRKELRRAAKGKGRKAAISERTRGRGCKRLRSADQAAPQAPQ